MRKSEHLLDEIKNDHRSGATALTLKAGEALKCRIRELESRPEELARELPAFAERLVEAQPAMASMRNLAVTVLQALPDAGPEDLVQIIDGFVQELQESTDAIAGHALGLIPEGARVITISYSSTVLRALKRAHDEEKRLVVICPESRPAGEGLRLAQALSAEDIGVVLCADAMAPSLVHDCDLVVVGGDALAPEGLVNKIGTYALALAAREVRIPCAALIATQKLLEHFDGSWIPAMDPKELLPKEIGHVYVINKYFELTPFELISHVVTEDGLFTREEARDLLP